MNWLPITVYLIPEMQLSWGRGPNQCYPLFRNVHRKCDQEQRGGHEGHFPDMKGTHKWLQAMILTLFLLSTLKSTEIPSEQMDSRWWMGMRPK